MDDFSGEVTRYLSRIRAGDADAKTRLLQLVLAELRRMAERMMRSERMNHTLQPTALVNELYLHLLTGNHMEVRDRGHFFALAAQAMRRILVDHARARRSQKRGGQQQRVDIEGVAIITGKNIQQMVELDQALERLEKLDARQCRVVELRFFAGLDEEEIARMLGVSDRTVKRDWAMAKAWLYGELQPMKQRDEDDDKESGAVTAVK
jgi:RNA polymerase sigma-70 factor (ECF subfamily)